MKPRFPALIAALAAICLWSCDPAPAGGSSTSTENTLNGFLVDRSGKAVPGARVRAFPAGKLPSGLAKRGRYLGGDTAIGAATVFTDAQGRYAFVGLPGGTYNLQGDYHYGELAEYHPAVAYAGDGQTLALGADTLLPPGSIKGKVDLSQDDNGGVICAIPGTSYLAISDSLGNFAITGVPQGKYDLVFRMPGYLPGKDTGVVVLSGQVALAPAVTLWLDPSNPPPAPKDVRAAYDPSTDAIVVSWRPVPVHGKPTYSLYSQFSDASYGSYGFQNISDTSFKDVLLEYAAWHASNIRHEDNDYNISAALPDSFTITYRLKTLDENGNISPAYSSPVSVHVPLKTRVYGRSSSIKRLPGSGIDSIHVGDTLKFQFTFRDSIGWADSLIWEVSTSGLSGKGISWVRTSQSTRSWTDTLTWVPDSAYTDVQVSAYPKLKDLNYMFGFGIRGARLDIGRVYPHRNSFTGFDLRRINPNSTDTLVHIGDTLVLVARYSDPWIDIDSLKWSFRLDTYNVGNGAYAPIAAKRVGSRQWADTLRFVVPVTLDENGIQIRASAVPEDTTAHAVNTQIFVGYSKYVF